MDLFEALLRMRGVDDKKALFLRNDACRLWHARLEHTSASTILKTILLVQEVDIEKCTLDEICQTCEVCKSKRHPRPARIFESKNSTALSDLLH